MKRRFDEESFVQMIRNTKSGIERYWRRLGWGRSHCNTQLSSIDKLVKRAAKKSDNPDRFKKRCRYEYQL